MRHIQAAAEQKMRAALARLPGGTHRFVDHLDDGSPIAVAITIAGDEATIDFSGNGRRSCRAISTPTGRSSPPP